MDFSPIFSYAGNGTQLDMNLAFVGGGTADVVVLGFGTDLQPFGFVSTTAAITGITFNNTVNDGFNMDNISGAALVPEPSSLLLLALGAIGFFSRRKADNLSGHECGATTRKRTGMRAVAGRE